MSWKVLKNGSGLSVFYKLFLVVFLTGLVLNILAALAFVLGGRPGFGPTIPGNVEKYSHYIAQEFRDPLNREYAKKLVEELGLAVKIEGTGWSWSNSPELPALSTLPKKSFEPDPPLPFRGKGRGIFLIVDQEFRDGPAKIYVGAPNGPVLEPNFSVLLGLLCLVTLVLLGSYLVIRKLLAPINSLSQGVEAVSEGKLTHRVPVSSNDEFARLADAFNSMTVKVKEMIQAREQLLLDVSHELRSPLGRAQIALELVHDEKATGRATRELAEMEQMIHVLLESARYDQGSDSLVISEEDIVGIAKDIAELYGTDDRKVTLKAFPPEISVPVDAERIGTVVRNLVENAMKYSDAKSQVEIEIRLETQFVEVAVSDSGQGIPSDELKRVFEPFYRVDKSRTRKTGGYGLGLSLCQRIIESHGGTMRAESSVGFGSRFSFRLPLKKEADSESPLPRLKS